MKYPEMKKTQDFGLSENRVPPNIPIPMVSPVSLCHLPSENHLFLVFRSHIESPPGFFRKRKPHLALFLCVKFGSMAKTQKDHGGIVFVYICLIYLYLFTLCTGAIVHSTSLARSLEHAFFATGLPQMIRCSPLITLPFPLKASGFLVVSCVLCFSPISTNVFPLTGVGEILHISTKVWAKSQRVNLSNAWVALKYCF